jgi:multidrug resistance efflux pump
MKINFSHPKHDLPENEHHMRVRYGEAKRKFPKFRWYIILLLVLSPLLYFLFDTFYQAINITAPGYIYYKKISVNAARPGIVKNVYVKPGDPIEKNELLLLLEDPVLESQYRQMKIQVQKLNDLKIRGQFNVLVQLYDKLSVAERHLIFVKEKLKIAEALNAEQELGMNEYMLAKQEVTNTEYEIDNIKIQIARENENQLKNLKAPSSYINQDADMDNQLKQLEVEISLLRVIATFSGKMIQQFVNVGEYVNIGTPLLEQTTSERPYIAAYVDPKYGKYTKLGQKVRIHFPNGKVIDGQVNKEPELTQRLPDGLVSTLNNRRIMILVEIKALEAIPPDQNLDGLPVKVYF